MEDWIKDDDEQKAQKIIRIFTITSKGTPEEKMALFHEFHNSSLLQKIEDIMFEINTNEQKLIKDYSKYLEDTFDPRVSELESLR